MDRFAECKIFAHFLASGNQHPGRHTICGLAVSGSSPSR